MPPDFFNPGKDIDKHGHKLPHWQQGEVMQFVTFRLGDALPIEMVRQWNAASHAWKNANPPPWTADEEAEYHRRFTVKLEKWLDQGSGSCLLKDAGNRRMLEEALMQFRGDRVHHQAWVIMPNHVHLIFKPEGPLEKLLQAWKSVSAKRIAKGSIWQPNYRDTQIRDGGHFANAVRYVRRNPIQANLYGNQYTLWQSERALAVS